MFKFQVLIFVSGYSISIMKHWRHTSKKKAFSSVANGLFTQYVGWLYPWRLEIVSYLMNMKAQLFTGVVPKCQGGFWKSHNHILLSVIYVV